MVVYVWVSVFIFLLVKQFYNHEFGNLSLGTKWLTSSCYKVFKLSN